MTKKRKYTHPSGWTADELATLRREWAGDKPVHQWDCLPGRSDRAIHCKARQLDLPCRRSHDHRGDCLTWRAIQRVLADGILRTAKQISELTGLNRKHIGAQLNAHPGKVYVADYTLGRNKHRLWALGDKANAEKPAPLTHAEVSRRQRRRAMVERPELFDAINARRRFRRAERAGKVIRKDPAASWIGTTPNHTAP